jgi:hypothetical protein
MTNFTLPPFVIERDGRWIDVDLRGDLGEWARLTAQDVLIRSGVSRSYKREKQLTKMFEGAGEIARRAPGASIVYLLYPALGEGIRAVVRFSPVDMSGWEEDEAWPVMLKGLIPDEPWEEPPEITEIATPAGSCHRIRRRYLEGEGNVRSVGEQLAYCWVFPQYGAGVVMTTEFGNLEEAGMWRPALDELASAAKLDEAS